jgi:hypothetical protein
MLVMLTMIIPHQTLYYSMFLKFRYFDIFGIVKLLKGGGIEVFGHNITELGGGIAEFFENLDVLPDKITNALAEAIPQLDQNLKGFADADAVLTAPETRSSSPVRIDRNEQKQSVSLAGLYPAGEGAGYAGGIMSAAIDGMLCAEALLESL